MPSTHGAENIIHARIGDLKSRDELIVVLFELPNAEHRTLTFESYVTRPDLKAALRHSASRYSAWRLG